MSRSDELRNEMKEMEASEIGRTWPETLAGDYARLAAVAAIEALAKIEDIDAQISKRSTK